MPGLLRAAAFECPLVGGAFLRTWDVSMVGRREFARGCIARRTAHFQTEVHANWVDEFHLGNGAHAISQDDVT